MPTILRTQNQHRESLISTFKVMTDGVKQGNLEPAIHYINRSTLKTDVEAMLGRSVSKEEAKQLLHAPSHIPCVKLAYAAYKARELQGMRMAARRFLQHTHGRLRADETKKVLQIIEQAEHALELYNQESED